MKKYNLTICVIALFAIGFTASDEEQKESPSSSKNETTEVVNNSTASIEEETVEEKAVPTSPKAVSQIKDINELNKR